MQKHVNLVDLVKSFPTNIYLQNLASIHKRTSPVKFAHLAEKSGKGSISNLSTKVHTDRGPSRHLRPSNERKRGRMSCKQNRNVIHLFLFSLFFRTALFCFPPPNGQRSSRPDFTGTTRVLNFSRQRSGKKTCEHVSISM